MTFRSGKYKGEELAWVQEIDPGYIRWISENRPEMLRGPKRKSQPKPKKQELTEEEIEQQNLYKTLPKLGWEKAF